MRNAGVPHSMPQDIDRHRLQELQARGAAIVEVLPDEEYTNEHLAAAISLPLQELRPRTAEERLGPDKQRALVTYCQGVDWDLSGRAAWRLETLGYTQVYRYFGGKTDWLAAGLPTEGKLASEPRIGALARRGIATCRVGQRVGELRVDGDLCVVVDEGGIVLGDLRGKALREKPDARVEEVMNPAPSTYRPNVSVHEMAHEFSKSGARRVLVSDGDGRLIGLLTREDVEKALSGQLATDDGPVLASSQ